MPPKHNKPQFVQHQAQSSSVHAGDVFIAEVTACDPSKEYVFLSWKCHTNAQFKPISVLCHVTRIPECHKAHIRVGVQVEGVVHEGRDGKIQCKGLLNVFKTKQHREPQVFHPNASTVWFFVDKPTNITLPNLLVWSLNGRRDVHLRTSNEALRVLDEFCQPPARDTLYQFMCFQCKMSGDTVVQVLTVRLPDGTIRKFTPPPQQLPSDSEPNVDPEHIREVLGLIQQQQQQAQPAPAPAPLVPPYTTTTITYRRDPMAMPEPLPPVPEISQKRNVVPKEAPPPVGNTMLPDAQSDDEVVEDTTATLATPVHRSPPRVIPPVAKVIDDIFDKYKETIQQNLAFPHKHPNSREIMSHVHQIRVLHAQVQSLIEKQYATAAAVAQDRSLIDSDTSTLQPMNIIMSFKNSHPEKPHEAVRRLQQILDQHWASAISKWPSPWIQHTLLKAEQYVQERLMASRNVDATVLQGETKLPTQGNFLIYAPLWSELHGRLFFRLEIDRTSPPISELLPEIRVGQWVFLRKKEVSLQFKFEVRSISSHTVILRCIDDSYESYPALSHGVFTVMFLYNPWPIEEMCKALGNAKANEIQQRLLNHNPSTPFGDPSCSLHPVMLEDKLAKLNSHQGNAVRAILQRPRLYTLWGPAGTGKTHTLVRAIKLILECSPKTKILVTATTDLAVNHIAHQLLPTPDTLYVRPLRFFLGSVSPYDLHRSKHAQLLRYSNFTYHGYEPSIQDIFDQISLDTLSRVNIVFATTLGCSVLNNLEAQFDYVFVDEAGQVTEAEFLIPCQASHPKTSFILAGDPKQLGPVLISPISEYYGKISASVLEKYFPSFEIVLRSGRTDVGVLSKCYRCHIEIVELLNHMFYASHLSVALRRLPLAYPGERWPFFPSPGVPIVFIDVEVDIAATHVAESRSEAHVVCDVIRSLYFTVQVKPEDICCITPYRDQQKKISLALPIECRDVPDKSKVVVGRIDQFQGQEMPVCIVSTVTANPNAAPRTEGEFTEAFTLLGDENRTNVALSRAKSVLVIVGSVSTIQREDSALWGKLLQYLQARKCIRKASELTAHLKSLRLNI